MFYLPCGLPYYDFMRPNEAKSYIRLLHASPDAPAVDIYANGNPVARNLSYRQFTPYLEVAPGNYTVEIYPAGQKVNPVLQTNADIPAQSIFTIAATGLLSELSLLPVPEPKIPIPAGRLQLRFVHLSPNAPAVDVTQPNGNILFRDVSFKEITDYIPVTPGTYTFQLRTTVTNQVVLYVPNINLRAARFYTIYAVGVAGGSPPLQVLIPLDGNSYLKL